MPKTITISDIKLKEALITRENGQIGVNLLFNELDSNNAVIGQKRIVFGNSDFTASQLDKFNDILTTISNKAKNKEGI